MISTWFPALEMRKSILLRNHNLICFEHFKIFNIFNILIILNILNIEI